VLASDHDDRVVLQNMCHVSAPCPAAVVPAKQASASTSAGRGCYIGPNLSTLREKVGFCKIDTTEFFGLLLI
jgi:hypothetical protein